MTKKVGELYLSPITTEDSQTQPSHEFADLRYARQDSISLERLVRETMEDGLIDINLGGELRTSLQDARREAFFQQLGVLMKDKRRSFSLDTELLQEVPDNTLDTLYQLAHPRRDRLSDQIMVNAISILGGTWAGFITTLAEQQTLTKLGMTTVALLAARVGAKKFTRLSLSTERRTIEEELKRRKRDKKGISGTIYKRLRR